MGQVVIEVGERDPVLRPDGLTDDDLVDVVELVPVVVQGGGVFNEGLVLGSSRNGDVQSLGREERLEVEQVEVVVVHKVSHQLKIRDVYEWLFFRHRLNINWDKRFMAFDKINKFSQRIEKSYEINIKYVLACVTAYVNRSIYFFNLNIAM